VKPLRRSGMDHTVLPAITAMPVFNSQGFTRWRLPRLSLWTSYCSLLLIYLPQKDERLSRPRWLTYSGWFTHISGHPSAAGWQQNRESSVVEDRRSTTVSSGTLNPTIPYHLPLQHVTNQHTCMCIWSEPLGHDVYDVCLCACLQMKSSCLSLSNRKLTRCNTKWRHFARNSKPKWNTWGS